MLTPHNLCDPEASRSVPVAALKNRLHGRRRHWSKAELRRPHDVHGSDDNQRHSAARSVVYERQGLSLGDELEEMTKS